MCFRLDNIYTRTGPILIAMNPFKRLPLYGENVMERYRGKPYGDLPPHPYQESEDCLQRLQGYGESQCVVICGESGAGKTETTKVSPPASEGKLPLCHFPTIQCQHFAHKVLLPCAHCPL